MMRRDATTPGFGQQPHRPIDGAADRGEARHRVRGAAHQGGESHGSIQPVDPSPWHHLLGAPDLGPLQKSQRDPSEPAGLDDPDQRLILRRGGVALDLQRQMLRRDAARAIHRQDQRDVDGLSGAGGHGGSVTYPAFGCHVIRRSPPPLLNPAA
jgi:hypothetical protein